MGTINDVKQAIDIAKEIGFPVIVKAAAGGGGRGMRVVNNPAEMANAFESQSLKQPIVLVTIDYLLRS